MTGKGGAIRSIALINPLGDYGIQTYTRELARALADHGVSVDIYCSSITIQQDLLNARSYRVFSVLGGALFKQRGKLVSSSEPYFTTRASASGSGSDLSPSVSRSRTLYAQLRSRIRRLVLGLELAIELKRRRYSVVWTQWPFMEDYEMVFWRACRFLRLPIVHSAHNVLPHEQPEEAEAQCRKVYRAANLIFVHSNFARTEFLSAFPETSGKVVLSRHGAWTMYPRRPEVRTATRARLGLREGQFALFISGGIRPYKNINVVLRALHDERCRDTVLILAGTESGYEETSPIDPLARTRRIVLSLGIADRVRLLPGGLRTHEMSDLLESVDALILPYVKSYGIGQLLLGMTFGKYIIATAAGGMDEYLADYSPCDLLPAPDDESVIEAIVKASRYCAKNPRWTSPALAEIQWPRIAAEALRQIEDGLSTLK